MQKLGLAQNFWFGHQGYEYVDLGRFWQIFCSSIVHLAVSNGKSHLACLKSEI